MRKLIVIVYILFLAKAACTYAGEDNSLFNPTPDDQLRPMTTERPSRMDSPYSIDAGQVQIETNIYGFIQHDNCTGGVCIKTRQHDVGGSTNLRIGLTNRIDIQFIGNLYQHQMIENRTAGTDEIRQGYGDTTVRLKINAVGNNPSDAFSLGILPYVKLPTSQDNLSNDEIEGGLGLPFNFALDNGWNISGMTQLNFISQHDNSGYDLAYVNAIMIGTNLTNNLSGYSEFYTYKAKQNSAKWENTLNFGTVYAVSASMTIDVNIQFGVTDAANDLNFFFGSAYRF